MKFWSVIFAVTKLFESQHKNLKFYITDFFSKCDLIRRAKNGPYFLFVLNSVKILKSILL